MLICKFWLMKLVIIFIFNGINCLLLFKHLLWSPWSFDPLLFSFLSSGLARHRVPPRTPSLTVSAGTLVHPSGPFRSLFTPYTSLLVQFWSWNYDWLTLHSVSQIMDPCWQDKIQDLFLFVFLIHKVHTMFV